MHKRPFAGLTALALAGGTLLGTAAPAQAADPTVLYVKQTATACSDTGPGTVEQPFCTIGAAAAVVTAGQTVDVGGGNYRERVTIANSGTPDQPIVFRSGSSNSNASLIGPTAGFAITSQHDIRIERFQATGSVAVPALDIRDASHIEVENGTFTVSDNATVPAVRLAGVTQSSLKRGYIGGRTLDAGVTMDAATTGVSLISLNLTGRTWYDSADRSVGVRVAGPGNTILNNTVDGFGGAAISVEAGATDTVVVNNQITGSFGYGIHNHGATGTAITNNTVKGHCLDGIRVDGTSAKVSVQNNLLAAYNPLNTNSCGPSASGRVELGIYDAAVGDTAVDYNNADDYYYYYYSSSPATYAWNGSRMGLSAFRAASGQAAHDLETGDPRDAYDSANSAAPGYQATDRVGRARADDPARPDTGAGPVTYADRGALETIRSPLARTNVTLDLAATSVNVNASSSEPGFVPIASYEFTFGDGTVVTQASPVVSHRYAQPGEYTVSTRVTGTDGRSGSRADLISVLPRTGTMGLLTLSGLRYVGPMANVPWPALGADHAKLDATGQFDLVDAGSGQVALFAPASGQYVTADSAGVESLSFKGTVVTPNQRFTLVRNADGTVSLKSASSGRYVTATANATTPLIANATTIGATQKFYRVNVADADRSLKARANNRFVTAESAGTKPLIANRTSVGPWERFDLVDLGNGQIGIFARADNRFVSADGKGTLPLIANRASVGAWERFTLIRNTDGTVSLKAAINSRYVTAESAGAKPLIANRTTIGTWEKFTLG